MGTKINREACSEKIQDVNIKIEMSEQAFFDLAHQKLTLIRLADKGTKESEHLWGIIHLIDSIQDQAVEQGFRDEVVFPLSGE